MFNQNSSYGRAMLDGIHAAIGGTFGNVHVVMNSSDTDEGNYQHLQDIFQEDSEGRVRFYTSVESAYAAVESNNNDVILLDGNSTHAVAAMVTVAKNRVHFIGLDYLLGINRSYGSSSKIAIGVTTAATDVAAFLNTGVRNSFRGIKFIGNNTVAEALYAFVDGGEYTYMENCETYESANLAVTGAADFVCNADSPTYVNCTFGSLASPRVGAIIRAAVLFTKGLAGSGKVARDVTFERCRLWINCVNTANRFAYGANATDIERSVVMEKCYFICNGASTAVPAQNIAFGASLTVGNVLLNDCVSVEAGTAMSTTTGVFVNGPNQTSTAGGAEIGISLQAS